MPTVPASPLSPEFGILNVLWSVRPYAGSQAAWYTKDYMADLYAAPSSLQGYRAAYALQAPDSPGVPVYRNDLGSYSNRKVGQGTFLLMAESVAQEGQGLPLLPTAQGGDGPTVGVGAFDIQECGGFVWNIPLALDDPFLGEFLTVAGSEQTEMPYIAKVAGAYLCRWRTIIASSGIDQEWMRRYDFGQGDGIAEFWSEPGFFHNPTQFGCISKNGLASPSPDSDSHIHMCSPCTKSSVHMRSDGSLRIESENIPLEWDKNGFNPIGYHGGDDYHPVIWKRLRHRGVTIFRYMGRDGVHLKLVESRAPFSVSAANGLAMTQIHAIQDHFDKLYFFDVATNTLTASGWTFAADGRCRYTINSNLLSKQKQNPDGTPLGAPVVSAAPHTSNHVAAILRATGTEFGVNNDYSVGIYVKLHGIGSTLPRTQRSGIDGLEVGMNHKVSAPNYDDVLGQDFLIGTSGFNRPSGAIRSRYFLCNGTFAQVQSRMRQIYLDGLNSSAEWNGVDE